MNNNALILAYAVYLPVTLALTYYVANTLFSNGKVFMLDIFRGREEIAASTNHLLRVGFYLLNVGFAMLMLKTQHTVDGAQTLLEVLSLKIGGFSIYLGVMLFFNLYLFFRGKRKSRENQSKDASVSAVAEKYFKDKKSSNDDDVINLTKVDL